MSAVDELAAGAWATDTVAEKTVLVLDVTGAQADEYYLVETQRLVSECESNRSEWAQDPVVEAVYKSDIDRYCDDGWSVDDVLGWYEDADLDRRITRYRFPAGRLDPRPL